MGRKAVKPSYAAMMLATISKLTHFGRPVSRQKIAKHLKKDFGCKDGAHFNTAMRKSLNMATSAGLLSQSGQSFKLTESGLKLKKPKKKKSPAKKKKKVVKKKKTTKKKASKKKSSRKKVSRKKKTSKKKVSKKKKVSRKKVSRKKSKK